MNGNDNFSRLDAVDPDANLFLNASSCNYFTIANYNIEFPVSNQFSLLNQNVQSFNSKKPQLETLIASANHSFHAMVLTETWNSVDNFNLCNIEGYNVVHSYRISPAPSRGGIGGGVSIFADCNLYKLKKIDHLSYCNQTIEACTAQIIPKNSNDKTAHFIVGIYRPHTDSTDNFVLALQQLLSDFTLQNKSVILAGDMNININGPPTGPSQNYLSSLFSYSYIPVITKPTRFPAHQLTASYPTNLDHIFINKVTTFKSAILDYDLSDHCGTTVTFDFFDSPVNLITNEKITFRPYSDENFLNLQFQLSSTNWDNLLNHNNANDQYNSFMEHINKTFISSFPIKTKIISEKRKNNPWVTPLTLEKIKRKSEYYKMYKSGRISKQENNYYKNRLNKDIQNDKKLFLKKTFENAKNNMAKSWKIIKSLVGTNITKKDADFIFKQAASTQQKQTIANNFNNFFATIGSVLASEIPLTETSPISQTPCNPRSFYFFRPTEIELSNIITNLKPTRTHINVLPVKLFKKLSPILMYPLLKIIEASFLQGIFPENLKTARITPLHKSGDYESPSNFRPISSLPYMSKIYEKLVTFRLLSFCYKYNIISPVQFGFQPGISTSDALLKITESIYKALDSREYHIATLLDIKKAFDSVDHAILLKKLEHYGIRGLPLKWFESYLSGRKCYTEIDSIKSDIRIFNVGVPQGSNLGPILFLIYVNNLPAISNSLQTQLFADDTIVSISGRDMEQIKSTNNSELEKISDWTHANKLTLNANKTEVLIVSNRLDNTTDVNTILQDEVITPCDSCKYLGVYLDRKMTFGPHIEEVIKKISRHTGVLYRIRDYLPTKARLDYYYAFVYPYLSYNVIFWGSAFDTYLNPLIIQHKRTIRTLSDASYRDHTSPLFKQLGLLKFRDIFKFHLMVHMHKALSNGEYAPVHNRFTRNRDLAVPIFHNLTNTQRAVSFIGPKMWNELPLNLRNIERLNPFKKALKKYLLDQYIE